MIAAWMLGSTVFALLLCVAAFCVEHMLRVTRRPTRTPWAVALVLSVVWPLMAPFVLTPARSRVADTPIALAAAQWSPATAIAASMPSQSAIWEQRAATLLLVVWALLSACLLVRLFVAARVLARVTREAQEVQLDGESVLVTQSLGPAVIGLWTPRVAVPEWFMGLDASLRAMVLRHEAEHCRSRDPQLVWLASLAVAIMPWNAGVWILSRRLRLALEIDCDARTLSGGALHSRMPSNAPHREADATKYGKLLLLIAQRQSSYPLASMLAESTSHLSRRITAMQMKPLRKPAVRVVLFGAVAAGAIAVACSPRVAADLTGPGTKPVSPTAVKAEAERMAPGHIYFESQVEVPVAPAPGSVGPAYPADLRSAGVEGSVLAMFVVNEEGLPEVATLKVLRTDNPKFEEAVRAALPNMRFVSAKVGGRPVKQLVQQPFSFVLSPLTKKSAGTSTPTQGDSKLLKNVPAHIPGQPYFESQVEVPVGLAASWKAPAYPAALKEKGVEGTVLVMFVVNDDGLPDMSTFKILKTDNREFDALVRDAVAAARFTPAMIGNKAVKQFVQQPFTFSLSR